MKLVLKILALPVLFVVKLICILGNLLTNIVSYVIGLTSFAESRFFLASAILSDSSLSLSFNWDLMEL